MIHRLKTFYEQFFDLFTAILGLYNASVPAKLFVISVTSSLAVPLEEFINHYIYSDWTFFVSFTVLLSVDVATGIVKASGIWDDTGKTPNTINYKVFILKLSEKFFVGCVWLYLTQFAHTHLGEMGQFGQLWVDYFGHSVVSVWIFWSICTNLFIITQGQFPPIGFLKSLTKLKDTGSLTDNTVQPGEAQNELTELEKKK